MEPHLWKFITKFRDDSGNHNMSSIMAPFTGKFRIERKDSEEFWTKYCDTVLEQGDKFVCHMAQKHMEILPLLVDVDLEIGREKIKLEENDHLYSLDEVKIVIKVYNKVIKEVIRDWKSKNCVCFLLEKDPYIKGNLIKNGFHLHFPRLWVRDCDHDLHIYPRVQKYLNDQYPNLFKKIGEINSGDLIDKQVAHKDWLLYGSSKNPNSGHYSFSKAFDHNGNEITLSEALQNYRLYDISEQEIKIDPNNYNYYLPRILSTHPANQVPSYLKTNLDCFVKKNFSTAQELTSRHESINVAEAVTMASELLNLISSNRADYRDSWIEMGWILYSIGEGCQEALDLWIDFSSKTSRDNFDQTKCIYEWNKMVIGKYTIGTLRHYASIDNPSGYDEWKKKKSSSRMNSVLNGGHEDLAKMLYDMYGNVFVCAGLKDHIWFQFKDHRWQKTEKGASLRNKIGEEITGKFQKKVYEICPRDGDKDRRDEEDPEDQKNMAKKVDKIHKLIGQLKSAPFKDNIMKEASYQFLNEKFLSKIDDNEYLLGFTNGVLDLTTCIFRDGKPEDYISKNTGYDYKEFNWEDPEIIEVQDFLLKVFPDPELRRYFLEYAASLLKGKNSNKNFVVMSGDRGDNAKSITIEFLEAVLGEYAVKLPTSLLVGKRTQSAAANPELARTAGIRFASLQEPDGSDVINIGILKELTGNDKFYARGMYKEGTDIRPMFKISLICNKLPKLKESDSAVFNRIEVLTFESWFPKDQTLVPKTFEEQMAKKIFPRDSSFSEKLPNMRQAFMWYLVQIFKEIKKKGYSRKPDKVLEATAIYKRNNDTILQFITENIKCDPDNTNVSISGQEAYIAFIEWFRGSFANNSIKPPNKSDFINDLSKRWGPLDRLRWRGYRLRSQRDDLDDFKAVALGKEDLVGNEHNSNIVDEDENNDNDDDEDNYDGKRFLAMSTR